MCGGRFYQSCAVFSHAFYYISNRISSGQQRECIRGRFGNHRIQKFDASGNFLTKWGSKGSPDGCFNEPNEVAVDGSGNIFVADTLNHRIQRMITDLCEYNGSLYLAWYEDQGSDKIYQVYVKKYNSGTNDWGNSEKISYSNNKAFNVKLKVYDGMLYAVWVENNGTRNQIRAKKYNGSSWSPADPGTLNYNPADHVTIPSVEVSGSNLYAAWSKKGNIRVKQYDGIAWSTADSNNGLNYDGAKPAHVPVLLNCSSTLYLLWLEENESAIYQVRAKKYNGTAWVEAGSGSLNYDESNGASMLNGFVHNGILYAAWTENGKVRIKSYHAAGNTWISADDGNVNYDPARASSGLAFVEYKGQLYLSWKEDNGTAEQIRMKRHQGSQ